jgi:hypothetical protein
MIRVRCPGCQEIVSFAEDLAGQIVICTECQQRKLRLPAPKPAAPDGIIEGRAISEVRQASPPANKPSKPLGQDDDDAPLPVRSRRVRDDDEAPSRVISRRDKANRRDEDDELRMPRARRAKKARPFQVGRVFGAVDGLMMCLIGLGAAAVLTAPVTFIFPLFGSLPMLLGFVAAIAGSIWFLVIAFREQPVMGLACMIVPFFSLYYLISRFAETWRPFVLYLAGFATIFSVYVPIWLHELAWGTPETTVPAFHHNAAGRDQFQGKAAVAPPAVTNDPVLDKALADLDSTDRFVIARAAEKLAKMQPDQHRAVVAQKLAALANSSDGFVPRSEVLRALGVWAGTNEVPVLIKCLTDRDPFAFKEACKALGKLRDERAVTPLVRCFQDLFQRDAAGKALRDMGPMAEKEVLALLNVKGDFKGDFLHADVIRLLKDIGTQLSVPKLQAVAASNNAFTSNPAREALQAIAARGNK